MEERTLFEREEATAQAERALRELREGFEEGRTQLGSTLIFSGAAGTGKTALIEAVRRSALDPKGGFTVVSARGGQLLRESPTPSSAGCCRPSWPVTAAWSGRSCSAPGTTWPPPHWG
ncbi:ATP-binding protein [Streptacidiphilus monticola]